MKPWLLEILACPMDKHYPLELTIFEIEDLNEKLKRMKNLEEMKEDLSFFFKSPVEEEKDLVDIEIINKKTADDKLLVHDTLVRKPSILKDYLDGIKASIEELKPITDLSNEDIKKLLEELIKLGGPVQDLINEASKLNTSQDASILAHIEEKLILLNWFKQSVEIKEGIMSCDNCKRWYPISNTIPQLLPDELRKEEKDKEFLNTWKNKIEDSIVKEGKPFHL